MKNLLLKFFLLAIIQLAIYIPSFCQTYTATKENIENRQWFSDARFGMFIHWGVYSTLANGEWVMERPDPIAIDDYENLPTFFNPIEFNATEWVSIAKNAGMKYITITSKHHDGFAMYDSKISDYDIVDRSPYKKDIIKMLADECKKQGIKLFFYYSPLDWHHPDYWPRGRTGAKTGRPNSGNWDNYLKYMNEQVKELYTNYGEIGGLWLDGMWDKKINNTTLDPAWQAEKLYQMVHSIQPATLIGNNHHLALLPGEDFQMFEKDLPGRNAGGFSGDAKIGDLPIETCETMNNSWGYSIRDNSFKSTKALVHYLVNAAGLNANFLLNVGPMPNGKIQPDFVSRLKEMGDWTKVYGETIYGTKGGPIGPRTWGATTTKSNKIYVHILNYSDKVLAIPAIDKKIKSALLFKDKNKVKFTQNADGIVLTLPSMIDPEDFDTVVELEF